MKKNYKSKSKKRTSKQTIFSLSLQQIVMGAALVLGFNYANAQCTARVMPYTETFPNTALNACAPTVGGWVGNTTASQAGWQIASTNYAGGTQPEVEGYGNQANGGVSETLTLVSPPVKTLGIPSATLVFKHNLYLSTSGASGSNVITIGVEMSPDNSTWTSLYSNTYNATSSLTSVVQETRTLPLTGLSSDSIFIRFKLSGVLFKVWGWEIDDVNFTTTTTSVPLFHPENALVYPNPATENIHVNAAGLGQTKVTICDVIGNTVYQSQLNNEKSTVNVKDFPKGIYLLHLQGEKGTITKKINIE